MRLIGAHPFHHDTRLPVVEDVLGDLGAWQALRAMPSNMKL